MDDAPITPESTEPPPEEVLVRLPSVRLSDDEASECIQSFKQTRDQRRAETK